jgi:hypothetical protein
MKRRTFLEVKSREDSWCSDVARASQGELGRGKTPAQRGGVEEDRRASAILTTHLGMA